MVPSPPKKRYAIVGASHRTMKMFMGPLLETYRDVGELVALVDVDIERIARLNAVFQADVPAYHADDFDRMVAERTPDVVIVACMDAAHHTYIIRALEHDLDVISEKPLTTDEVKCRVILAAEKKSRGRVTVTFNYRYSPKATRIRELLAHGVVGRVVNVDLNWHLDTYHGASYFMRWNRRRECSGGLNVHKATHHFDLVQWWIGQRPVEVFAYGARNYYGPDGPRNPSRKDGRHCPTCAERSECDYYMRWHRDEWRGARARGVELDEHVSGLQELNHYKAYDSRRCIYDSEIDIEDTYSAVVKYDGGATLSYSLNASTPFEGYRLGINGLDGRIETEAIDPGVRSPLPEGRPQPICWYPLFGGCHEIYPPKAAGGHGGGDPLLRDDLFRGPDPRAKVQRQAPLLDGVLSVLTGVAVYRSIAEHRPVTLAELLGEAPGPA